MTIVDVLTQISATVSCKIHQRYRNENSWLLICKKFSTNPKARNGNFIRRFDSARFMLISTSVQCRNEIKDIQTSDFPPRPFTPLHTMNFTLRVTTDQIWQEFQNFRFITSNPNFCSQKYQDPQNAREANLSGSTWGNEQTDIKKTILIETEQKYVPALPGKAKFRSQGFEIKLKPCLSSKPAQPAQPAETLLFREKPAKWCFFGPSFMKVWTTVIVKRVNKT